MSADKILDVIRYRHDGPVTPFVATMRAMRLVADGQDPDVVGNVLAEYLTDYCGFDMNEQHDFGSGA